MRIRRRFEASVLYQAIQRSVKILVPVGNLRKGVFAGPYLLVAFGGHVDMVVVESLAFEAIRVFVALPVVAS